MAYQIRYSTKTMRRYPTIAATKKNKRKRILGFAVTILLITSITLHPVREWLFPGDLASAERAANRMVETLEKGGDMKEAVSVFCREVLAHGLQD